MKYRRRIRRPVHRRTAKPPRAPQARRVARKDVPPVSWGQIRVVVCGVVFVALIALKLLLPGSLAPLRGTLSEWLVRDADFVAAFSAVGHAVSGEGGMLESLEGAYIAVFGEAEAKEVSGAAELAVEQPDREDAAAKAGSEAAKSVESTEDALPRGTDSYPEHAAAEQRILGFDYAAPLQGQVTSGFGWRTHPTTGREAFHYGVDIAAAEGTEIDCFADGRVGVVAQSVELGNYLTVHHKNGIMTLYAHCSKVDVQSGEEVKKGEKLAEAGSTGNATGAHLHFEIHDGEDRLDPLYYLS